MVQLKGKHIEKKLTLWNKLWEINTLSKFIQDYSRFIQELSKLVHLKNLILTKMS